MALSEISINDVVLYHTNMLIAGSDYQLLRKYLLERKPLSSVIENIEQLLSGQCTTDKQDWLQYHTQVACISQQTSDTQEAMSDEREKNNDQLLAVKYRQELPLLENKLMQIESKCSHQQGVYNRAQQQLDELKLSLSQVNRSISQVRSERQVLNFQYPYPDYGQGNYHTHYSNGPGLYPTYINPLSSQLAWDRLYREESRLNEERSRLNQLIHSKDAECVREKLNLDSLYNEKKQVEEQCSSMKRQMEVDFPNKEEQRQIRHQARMYRRSARRANDPTLQQLSSQNLEALQKQIAIKNHELDSTKENMMRQTVETSYPLFLTQLEQAFQNPEKLNIPLAECEALKLIMTMMKGYREAEEGANTINRMLGNEKSKLRALQNNLRLNKVLIEENTQLGRNSESAGNFRTTALYLSLFGVSAGLLSAGLVTALTISPLFFIIPGGLGLLTAVSLTIALVYHFKKAGHDEQISKNKKQILENETAIFKQENRSIGTDLNPIPDLSAQIETTEHKIAQFEMQIQEKQHSMNQFLSKAEQVTSTYQRIYPFFPAAQVNGDSFPTPSAPIQYDVDALLNYGRR